MSDLSLMAIIGADPEFGRRISKKVEEIKHDKRNLLEAADDYGQKYKDEILEGTEKRNRMLTEGAQRGLSEEEVISQYGRFVPSVYTPILNLLYFLLRETADEDALFTTITTTAMMLSDFNSFPCTKTCRRKIFGT